MKLPRKAIRIGKKYSRYIDRLATHDLVMVKNGGDGLYLAKAIKQDQERMLKVCPVGYNEFGLFTRGKRPKKIRETTKDCWYLLE